MKSLPSIRALRRTFGAAASVLFALPAIGDVTWNLVTDASTLAVDDVVIIAASGYDVALSTTQNNNNRGQATITKSGDTCTFGNDVQQFTLQAGTTSGSFAFYTGSGYIYAASSGSNYLRTETSKSANSSWSISIASGVATVIAQGSNTRNKLQYNLSSKVFSCYASDSTTQKTICLYRKTGDGGDDPPPQPSAPTISVSPTSTTVDVNHPVTATITTNDAVTSVTASMGTISGNTWSWTPTTAGQYTVTFTAIGAAGTSPDTKQLTITVTSGGSGSSLPVPTIAQASNLLSNGNGFTANWSAVSGVTGYEIQIATNALFDAVPNVILEEHFDTLATGIPNGWSGPKEFYNAATYGAAAPAYAFKEQGKTLVSPSFSGGYSVSFSAAPANGNAEGIGSVITITETKPNGGTEPYPITIDSKSKKTYGAQLTGTATKVSFTFTQKNYNIGIDDVFVCGTPFNTVVQTSSASGASTSSKAVTGLSPNTTYYVRVRSVSGSNHSDWSSYTTVTTEAGNTNYAPEITSFSPATATVALGSTQAFSVGYSDVNHNDSLTLAVTDNGAPLATESLSGTSGTHSYSYAATTPGTHALVFTLSDGTASATTNATVTVPVPVPMLAPIDEETLLDDGTGFTVEWSDVPVATGYELQIAVRALREHLLEEDFDDLEDAEYPTGWTGSGTSDLDYNSNSLWGEASPAFKFKAVNQTLVTPAFAGGGFVSFYARPNGNPGSTITITEARPSGEPLTHDAIVIDGEGTYTQELSGNATQLTFTFASKVANIIFDDVDIYGPGSDTLVQTLTPAAGTTSTNVVGLLPNTTYSVRIRALYNAEASAWSDYVSARTPASAPVPPEISSVAQASEIAAGGTAHITVTYSDANEDPLQLSLSIAGAAAQPLDLASGGVYDYTPTYAGIHRLIFSVTDGQFTSSSTNDITVVLSAPVASDATGATSSPPGFTAHWTSVPLAEGYTVEVATSPLFDAAPGGVVFTEDFSTLSTEELPTAWTSNAERDFRVTSATRCGEKPPAFRFGLIGSSGTSLTSPEFAPGAYLQFFAHTKTGPQKLRTIGSTPNGDQTIEFTIAEGGRTYTTNFSTAVTSLRFEFEQITSGGYVTLDDVLVRTSAAENTVVATVAAAAGASSIAVSQLPGAPTYYYRVRATGTGVASDWSNTIEVPFLGTPKNIVFHSAKYIEDGSSLTWDAAIGATSYRVKMLEGTITPDVALLEEFFDDGKTAPDGWSFKNITGTLGDQYCGESAPALKFDKAPSDEHPDDPHSSITTPELEYPATRVSFVGSASGTTGGTLTVYALTNGTWQSVATLSPRDKAKETFSYPLPANTSKVKIEFTEKMSGTNFAIDDLVVWGTGPVWHEYRTFDDIATPSLAFSDLRHDTPYSFTVSAINEYGEATAEPLVATTPPTNPATVLKFR